MKEVKLNIDPTEIKRGEKYIVISEKELTKLILSGKKDILKEFVDYLLARNKEYGGVVVQLTLKETLEQFVKEMEEKK